VAFSFTKFLKGINLVPKSASTVSSLGDLDVTTDGQLHFYNGTIDTTLTNANNVQTFTNKTIDGNVNTIINVSASSLPSDIVYTNATQTLTNKTLTSPILNSPSLNTANVGSPMTFVEGAAPSNPSAGNRAFYAKSDGFYEKDSAGVETQFGAASGDVVGPGSSTDNAIAKWDGTGGNTLQNSNILIDTDDVSFINILPPDNVAVDADPGMDVELRGTAKLAGTGDGGGLFLRGGESTGGNGGPVTIAPGSALVGNDGYISLQGRVRVQRQSFATSGNVNTNVYYVAVTDTSAPRTLTLPTITTVGQGTILVIKDESGSAAANNITIAAGGSDIFDDGGTTKIINANNGSFTIIGSSSSHWRTVSDTNSLITGPGSSASGRLVSWSGTTGKIITNSTISNATAGVLSSLSGTNLGLQTAASTDSVQIGFPPNALLNVTPYTGSTGVSLTPSAGNFSIKSGSDERLLIDSSGNFSVKSGSSVSRLSIDSTGAVTFRNGSSDKLSIDTGGNVVIGSAALATNATNGFLNITSSAGAPTGVPTAFTGRVPIHYDSTNNILYVYDAGWVSIGAPVGTIVNGGNTLGSNISIGTNDAFTLGFETNNIERLTLSSSTPLLSVPDSNTNPKDFELRAGKGVSGNVAGGDAILTAGDGIGTGAAGDVVLKGGTPVSGNIGQVQVELAGSPMAHFEYNNQGACTFKITNVAYGSNDPSIMASNFRVDHALADTSDNTPTSAFSYSLNDGAQIWDIKINAFDGTDSAAFHWVARVKTVGGVPDVNTLSTSTNADAGASTWNISIDQSTPPIVSILVTGQIAKDISWNGVVTITGF